MYSPASVSTWRLRRILSHERPKELRRAPAIPTRGVRRYIVGERHNPVELYHGRLGQSAPASGRTWSNGPAARDRRVCRGTDSHTAISWLRSSRSTRRSRGGESRPCAASPGPDRMRRTDRFDAGCAHRPGSGNIPASVHRPVTVSRWLAHFPRKTSFVTSGRSAHCPWASWYSRCWAPASSSLDDSRDALAVAFALAAVLSPTDAVAVSAIASRVPIPKRLLRILEGESLLNDASGLVCMRLAVAATLTGSFSIGAAFGTFAWLRRGWCRSVGLAVTLSANMLKDWVSRHFGEETGSHILISLLIPFVAYILAARVQASGILAAVAAGIAMDLEKIGTGSANHAHSPRGGVGCGAVCRNGVILRAVGRSVCRASWPARRRSPGRPASRKPRGYCCTSSPSIGRSWRCGPRGRGRRFA